MSTVYCFEKLHEAINRPETGHLQSALGEHGYIDRILRVVERFSDLHTTDRIVFRYLRFVAPIAMLLTQLGRNCIGLRTPR